MADSVYEGLFILDSNRYARDQAGVSGQVEQLITKNGGELLVSRLWEDRKLAYPIRGQKKGAYWLTYFRLDRDKITPLNEETQRTDNILRHLILKVDPRIVDTLVEHAQAGKSAQPETVEKSNQKDAEAAGDTTAEAATEKKDEADATEKQEAAVE